jgi:hypothetical protein
MTQRRAHRWQRYRLTVAGMLAVLAGCDASTIGLSWDGTEVVAENYRYTVELPFLWRKLDGLNELADLQAGNPFTGEYLIGITDPRSNVAASDLASYAATTVELLAGSLESARVSEPRYLRIADHDAIQYEIAGTLGGIEMGYLHTSIQGVTDYFELVSWTVHSRFDNRKSGFQRTLETFAEVR